MLINPSEERQRHIKSAFLEMLEEKPFSEITMKALADKLQMTRQNIYRYYSSREQIFADFVEDELDSIFNIVEQVAPELTDSNWNDLVDLGINLIYQNKRSVCVVMSCGQDETMYKLTKSFIRRCLGHLARIQGITIRDTVYLDIVASQLAGGGFYMLKAWTENNMNTPPEKIANIYKSFSGNLIQQLLQECE